LTDASVKIIAYDSLKTPTSVSKTLNSARYSCMLDRDIKVFELGSFAFLMDDLFSGLKLPNYITDFNRSRKVYKIDFSLLQGLDGDDQGELQQAADDMLFFFDVTCGKYRYNKLEAGAVTTDQCDTTGAGVGPIYGRIKNFSYNADMVEYGRIDCSVEFWTGFLIRVMD